METELVSLLTSPVTLLLVTVAILVLFLKSKRRDVTNLPPGPRGWEALKCVSLAQRRGDMHILAETWSRRYGEVTFCRSVLGDMCFLNSARLVREVYGSKDLGALTADRPRTFSGWFVFNDFRDVASSGPSLRPEWPKMRRLFHNVLKFYGDGVEHMESVIQTELHRLVTDLETSSGQDVEMNLTISDSLLCVIGALLAGEHLQSGSKQLRAMKKLVDHNDDLFNFVIDMPLSLCPWLRFVPLLPFKSLCRDVIAARDEVMSCYFTASKNTHVSGNPRGMVDVMLDEQSKEDNQWLHDDHIRGLILDTIVGAYITSLQTLKAAFLYLTHYPEARRRLQKEVDENIGERPPRIEDRNNLPFTESFVLETLRHSSFIPLSLVHEVAEDVTVDGYTIPKGTTIFGNHWVFNRDPKVFSDPDRFLADRFLDDEGHLLPANDPKRMSFLPFSVGKRSCPGEAFARSRVFLYITTLLQRFDVLPPKNHPLLPDARSSWDYGLSLLLKPYHVIFRPRA